MKGLRKYLGILFILCVFPMVHFVANNFILESSDDIYNHVPQEADVVIEINNRNFLTEMMYQKVFNEEYFNEKVFPPDKKPVEQPKFDIGVNAFAKTVIFREVWSDEMIWVMIMPYTDEGKFKNFISDQFPASKVFFNDEYAVVQVTPSVNQTELDKHMEKIVDGSITPFSERVQLAEVFDPEKEINMYLVHESISSDSKLIDGHLSLDFLADEIRIDGEFIPTSDLKDSPSIAYELNEESAFSMRSSLNLFNTIFWFSAEKFDNVPSYNQMAFDYDGVRIFWTHKDWGYPWPVKSLPDLHMEFFIDDMEPWHAFLDGLQESGQVKVDSSARMMATNMGTFFQYEITDNSFGLKRGNKKLAEKSPSHTYFAMQTNFDALLSNCKFAIDNENPPESEFEATMGMGIAEEMLAEMKLFATMETFEFTLKLNDDDIVVAEGHGKMKRTDGHSIIESVQFMMGAMPFLTDNLSM